MARSFALGGYAMGMYLMRQIGSRGVYGNPILPDFMVFLNLPEACPGIGTARHVLVRGADGRRFVPGLLAFCSAGWRFRSRRHRRLPLDHHASVTYALLLAFFRNDFGFFGGNNGLTDFRTFSASTCSRRHPRGVFALSCLALVVGS